MKSTVIIIQSSNGVNKSSIIRTISQILIGLNKKTVVNLGELGSSDNISSVVEIGQLKIGVISESERSSSALNGLKGLISKACDIILCAVHSELEYIDLMISLGKDNNYSTLIMESNWSSKLEVNFLKEEQVQQIIAIIDSIERSK